MNTPIRNVSLKFPCMEDWNKMDTSTGQRICSRCQHKVIDFTKMSDEEFQAHLKASQHVCGRFNKSQLSTEFKKYAAATLIAASAIGTTACETIEPASTPPTIPIETVEEIELDFVTTGIVLFEPDTVATDTTVFIAP